MLVKKLDLPPVVNENIAQAKNEHQRVRCSPAKITRLEMSKLNWTLTSFQKTLVNIAIKLEAEVKIQMKVDLIVVI